MPIVSDVMSPYVISTSPSDSVETARETLVTHGVNCLPVLDNEHLMGVVSAWDLNKVPVGDSPVSEVMTTKVEKIGPHDTTTEAARRMVDAFIHHLVVIGEKGEVLGVLSSFDLLPELAERD